MGGFLPFDLLLKILFYIFQPIFFFFFFTVMESNTCRNYQNIPGGSLNSLQEIKITPERDAIIMERRDICLDVYASIR